MIDTRIPSSVTPTLAAALCTDFGVLESMDIPSVMMTGVPGGIFVYALKSRIACFEDFEQLTSKSSSDRREHLRAFTMRDYRLICAVARAVRSRSSVDPFASSRADRVSCPNNSRIIRPSVSFVGP